MAAPKLKLDAKTIPALPRGKHPLGADSLYLEVTRTGSRSWTCRLFLGGKERWAGLGSWPEVSIAKARQHAQEMREEARRGLDPVEERKKRREAEKPETGITVRETLTAYREAHQPAWRPNYLAAVLSLHNAIAGEIGDKPIAALKVDDVLALLRGRWLKTPSRARKMQSLLALAFEFAAARGWADAEKQNPAAWSRLRHLLPKRERGEPRHLRALGWHETPAFWSALKAREGVSVEAMRVVVLTGCRTTEVLKLRWDEVDLDAAVMTIPPARMKAGVAHSVPLVPEALAALLRLHKVRRGPYCFPSHDARKPLSGMALLALLDRMQWREKTTTHGLRSALRSWCQDEGIDSEVAEALLAHSQSAVVNAYARSQMIERKRAALLRWAAFVTGG